MKRKRSMFKFRVSVFLVVFSLISCKTHKLNRANLEKDTFQVVHINNEIDGQTLTLKNNKGQLNTTVISIPNGNWVELEVGSVVSIETGDIINKMNPPHLISKRIVVLGKQKVDDWILSSISTDKTVYVIGEPIYLNMVVLNRGKKKFTFLPWKTPIENSFTGSCMDVVHNDENVPYKGILVKRMPPTPEDYITLGTGDTSKGKVNLLEGYDLNKRGVYHIRFNGSNDKLPSSNMIEIKVK